MLQQALRTIAQQPEALVAVVGPTASGKTSLAVELAERLDGEIVSADSVQIYRHFDIGSGKPSVDELARARHHLIGVLDPLAPVDASRYAGAAAAAVRDIRSSGKRPIVVGGTYLWVKALLFGLAAAPGADASVRARHRDLAERDGREALHARLAAVDAELARRLHPNDFVRVSRGLEVYELTGRPLSTWQAEHGFRASRQPMVLLAPRVDPGELTRRIEGRVAAFLRAGWVDEVRQLLRMGFGDARALRSVGYREVSEHVQGRLEAAELAPAVVRSTRVFARRQRTWLGKAPVHWLDRTSADS